MGGRERQTVGEVAVMVLDDINNRLTKMDGLSSLSDIRREISELRDMIASAKKVLAMIERANQRYQDKAT